MNLIKRVISIMLVCVLFTNCYSYRNIDIEPNSLVVNNKYHIDLKNGKQMKIYIDSVSRGNIYTSKKGIISLNTVKVLEEGTYSKGKTVGLGVLGTLGVAFTTGLVIAATNFSLNFGN